MVDPSDDITPPCSIQRSLEILGDRWTILIMRDAFRGIRRRSAGSRSSSSSTPPSRSRK
jgi:DNA-binding HxlR family transcriptional regulator